VAWSSIAGFDPRQVGRIDAGGVAHSADAESPLDAATLELVGDRPSCRSLSFDDRVL
jgi:hypothetical protein